jgi:hypothetical protein
MEVGGKRLTIVSAILMAASLTASLYTFDWMWAIISAIGLSVLLIPTMVKGKEFTYHRSLLIISLIPFTLYLILVSADLIVDVDDFICRYLSLLIQPLACMACAYMLFVSIDANSETVLSKRWIFVLSVAFTCTFAVAYLYFLFWAMQDLGYPLYIYEFEGPDALDNTDSNRFMMLPVNLAVACSIVYGLIIDRSLRKVEAKDLTRYYGGVGNEE